MQIIAVQILRALAALAVVIGHAQAFFAMPMEKLGQSFGWNYLLPWGAGVDLFFVIFGFIMVYSSEKLFAAQGGAQTFLWRRLTRIAPLYWSATALMLLKTYAQHRPIPDGLAILASFFFLPFDSNANGVPHPVYELGWTLNYEMFFYVVFACFLFARRETTVLLAGLALTCLIGLGALMPATNIVWLVWTQPITLEFIFGMALALLVRKGAVLPGVVRFALIVAAIAILLRDYLDSSAQPLGWITLNDFMRVLAWGIPAAMAMAACVLTSRKALSETDKENWLAGVGKHLGDASYALYLFHPFVLGGFSGLWFALGLNARLPAGLGVTVAVVASLLAALLVYRWFERPMTMILQGMGKKKPPSPVDEFPTSAQATRAP